MVQKKIPLRRCSGCGQSKRKRSWCAWCARRTAASRWIWRAASPGAAPMCAPARECLAKARKAKRFERALEVQIPDEVYGAMEAEIAKGEHDAG